MNENEKIINALINGLLENGDLDDTQKVHIMYLILTLNAARVQNHLETKSFQDDETEERLSVALSVFSFLIDLFEKIFNINTNEEIEDDEECENEA